MAFLKPDKIINEYKLEIKEKILPEKLKPNRKLSGGTGKAEYVTIHNTNDINEAKGTTDAEQYARATFNNAMGGVTVHYYIDEADCWHILNDDEVGYHAADSYKNASGRIVDGPGNGTSIAIEIIMDGSGSRSDKEAEERGARLAAILLYKHSLTIDRLTTHNRWYPKKYCPIYILPHWSEFKKRVENYLTEIKAAENKAETEEPNETGYLYRVQVGAFKVRKYAEDFIEALNEAGFNAFIVEAGDLLRIQVGAFRYKEYAQQYTEKLKEAGFDAFLVTASESESKNIVPGDADGDGKITAADARQILRASVGLENIPVEVGDINGDGKITASDAREALKKSVEGGA